MHVLQLSKENTMQTINQTANNSKIQADALITSYSKKVKDGCQNLKKGTSRLTDKIFFLFNKNLSAGYAYTIISTETLATALDYHPSMIVRYIKEATQQGLLTVEKVRGKNKKHRWKFTVTQKLFNIKNCGTLIPDMEDNFSNLTLQNAESNLAQSSRNIEKIAPYIYRNKEGLNRACARKETFFDDGQEKIQLPPEHKNPKEVSNEITPTEQALTAVQLEKSPVKQTKPSKKIKKPKRLKKPKASRQRSKKYQDPKKLKQAQQALAILKDFEQQHSLIKPLEIQEQMFMAAFLVVLRSHFGTVENFAEYLDNISKNPFLMGQRPMKSGALFVLNVGVILSPKLIEMYWEKKQYFDVWPERKKESEEDMARKAIPVILPRLTREEVIAKGITPFDQRVKAKLFELLGEDAYKSWIYPNDFMAIGTGNDEPKFEVSNPFVGEMLQHRFSDQLRQAFCNNALDRERPITNATSKDERIKQKEKTVTGWSLLCQ